MSKAPRVLLKSDNLYPERPHIPEHDLLIAILLNAIADLNTTPTNITASYTPKQQFYMAAKIRKDAAKYIASNSTRPFSFVYLCEHLGISPEALRRRIKKLEETSLNKQQTFRVWYRDHRD